jgi:deazaflavin-dependent oxidoreductase (nitroreductase family)
MTLPRSLARANRRILNPITRRLSGHIPPFATVIHEGRRSGREYRTPVWAFRTRDGYVVALTYGPESEWARNVVAAGRCHLVVRDAALKIDRVDRLEGDAGLSLVPAAVRAMLKAMGVRDFLLLRGSA